MRSARAIAELPGVEEAGLMIGTPANKEILRGGRARRRWEQAGPGDLIIALRASNAQAAEAAMIEARRLLDRPRGAVSAGAAWQPRTLRGAMQHMPDANLALISVPGDFAAAEARKALRRGLNVMIFSDNVPLRQEVALKREARDLTPGDGPRLRYAIIAGVPLAFANARPKGDIGTTALPAPASRRWPAPLPTRGGASRTPSALAGVIQMRSAASPRSWRSISSIGICHPAIVLVPPPAPEVPVVLARAGNSTSRSRCAHWRLSGRATAPNVGRAGTRRRRLKARWAQIARIRARLRPQGRGRLIRGLYWRAPQLGRAADPQRAGQAVIQRAHPRHPGLTRRAMHALIDLELTSSPTDARTR
jgi:hypothetical protein